MDPTQKIHEKHHRRSEWRFQWTHLIALLYITSLTTHVNCQSQESITKTVKIDKVETNNCHSCHSSSKGSVNVENVVNKTNVSEDEETNDAVDDVIEILGTITKRYILVNVSETQLEEEVENILNKALSKDRYEIADGVEIKSIQGSEDSKKETNTDEGRALFSKFSYEYRLLQKFKNFVDTHVLSINLPKAAKMMGFRSFGLNKFFVPLLIGGQVLLKSILFAMFLPSILGSFGKILGKGISQLSASSSQASYPPAPADDQTGYNNDNKDFMGYETSPTGAYAYPNDGFYGNMDQDANDLSNVDMSRYGAGGQKVSYLPTKNGYYKGQMATANNYKVFQKIPASSMILSNYDPFYSPLLSRLDGIFARLGLTPSDNSADGGTQIGGQNLSDVKLEACREQLICLMYASPAKYAPYSNLVSAQLSRELNELRRPVSDNPEILRFFRYMRAARRGQEGADCTRAHPACSANTAPAHTMIAAYHDINKLVTARKLKN
ncbi:uncharacterized protein LOC114364453 isoform X1 [Ostrinia furnacalis]|uniref:uncharacterized protein LOC114364453 isoform X1 n=1 Tax=Ostrinia furnacalis TaxID=93504 RepID=UPI00103D342A|nr:uncharacterized protein LOC114364453 isoform X1 [Ostrinia furnacalis]